MKKILFACVLGCLATNASAAMPVVETINSTATVTAVACSTSTANRLDTTFVAGKSRAWVRLTNQDSSANVYIGFDTNVSTSTLGTLSGFMGEKIVAGGNAPYPVGKDIKIYCKSDGSSSALVTVAQFGQ